MKKIIGILAMLLLIAGCVSIEETKKPFETKTTPTPAPSPAATPAQTNTTTQNITQTNTQTKQKTPNKGKAVFGITDAAVNLNDISSLKLTISAIAVHKEGGDWQIISSTPVTQDLLLLKRNGETGFLTETELEEGNYDQIRFTVSNTRLTITGEERKVELPSGVLKFTGNLIINGGVTSSALFDFDLSKSLHKTGLGRYLLIPVVKYETRTAVSTGVSGNTIGIAGGEIKTSKKLGMNINGDFSEDYELDPNEELSYIDGKIRLESETKVVPRVLSKGNSTAAQELEKNSRECTLRRRNC